MADDAGFAVALTIREKLLKDALLVAYAGGSFPRTLNTAAFPGGLPGGPPDAVLDVFLGPPEINAHADNTLTLTLEMWGQLSVDLGGLPEAGQIDGQLVVRIQPSFGVSGTNLELAIRPSDVSVASWDFTVLPPSSFSSAADSYFRSSGFRDRLQSAIQSAITLGVVSLPKIDISFLRSLVTAVDMTAESRVRQGVVLIGLNIRSEPLTLVGNAELLTDFARNNDLAAVIDAKAVPIFLQDVQAAIKDEVEQEGATLDGQVSITPDAGKFVVSGAASQSAGSATFSFSLIPKMFGSKPGAFFRYMKKPVRVNPRTWPAIGFAIADVNVDVDPAAWVVVVGAVFTVLNFGIPFLIANMVSQTAAQLTASIGGRSTGTPIPRVQRLPPANPAGAPVRIEIAEYVITPAEMYIGIKVKPEPRPAALIGLTSIPADFRAETVSYEVRLPFTIGADDPALRIRWTVIDLASGNVLVNQDDVAAGRETFAFAPETVGAGLSQLRIAVRVYRTLGSQITDFFNDGISLQIRPPLSPGSYVRWYYDVKNPQVRFDEPSDAWAFIGETVVRRHSNIHRTDRPCAMAAKHSRYTYQTDALDSLPFPLSQIGAHRSELCDYCFYGGPAGLRPSL